MNSREQTLAIILIGAMVATVAGGGGYYFIIRPLAKYNQAEAALTQEVDDLSKQLEEQDAMIARLKTTRARSLPADLALVNREYVVALERMADSSGVPKGYTINPKSVDSSARSVPEIAKGKPIYTRVAFEVVFKKTDLKAFKEFLRRYYEFGLLHQITALIIKKDEDPGSKNANPRSNLTMVFTTEAIIVEGAENRKTLLPVPTSFEAIGGGALYLALATNPEAAHGVSLPVQTPALSPLHRDYDLIVKKDPFFGPIPDVPPEKFKLETISNVKVRTDKEHDPIPVKVKGEGSIGAKVTAIASGSLYAEGALKVKQVDPKTNAIELPKTSAYEGTATISVIATSADGTQTEKTTFKVSIEEDPPGKTKEDISGVIILTGTASRSDGTAWVRVFNNASLHRYTIEATPTGVSVLKESKRALALPWQKDRDYDQPKGVLGISDEESGTKRTFQVIAVDIDGLIVADLKPDSWTPDKPKDGGKGDRPGKGPPGPGKGPPPKQGHANPLAVIGGNMIVAVQPPKFYRWQVGQSLKTLKPLTDDEMNKVRKAVEASGPVFDVAITAPAP